MAVEGERDKKKVAERTDGAMDGRVERRMAGWVVCREAYWVLDLTLIQKHAVLSYS